MLLKLHRQQGVRAHPRSMQRPSYSDLARGEPALELVARAVYCPRALTHERCCV
jgi:hypothetical protein